MLLGLSFSAQPAGGVSPDALQGLPWRSLVFEGQRHFIKTRIEASLERLRTDEALPALVASPQGKPVSPGGAEIVVINTKSAAEGPFVGGEQRDMTVWFDPVSGAALQRDRLRGGRKSDRKLYRFTEEGVYRLRRKPKDQREAALPPEGWTRTKESFYPYPAQAKDCRGITEASVLLYKLSVMPLTDSDVGPSMCVFHQQQVHRVTVQHRGEERLEVDYGQGSRQITAVKLALEARRLAPEQSDEHFAFLGLEGEIEILLAEDSRIPVRVSGTLPRVGSVSFDLKEALAD